MVMNLCAVHAMDMHVLFLHGPTLAGFKIRIWLVLNPTRNLVTHLYSSASREFLSRNPSLSKWQLSHFLCLWSNCCQRCYVTLGHLMRKVMGLPSCGADDWSTTAVDLGLPAKKGQKVKF